MQDGCRMQLAQGGMYTVDEAMARLKVCKATLYKLMNAGELASVKIGKCRRVPVKAVDELLARGMVGA